MLRKIYSIIDEHKGFTLAELLIVVAVIAVLVAINVPIFSTQLEKSREAADLANVRGAYAEVMTAAITQDTSDPLYDSSSHQYTKTVDLKQKQDGWSMASDKLNIGGVSITDTTHWKGSPKAGGTCTVIFDNDTYAVTIYWNGYTLVQNKQWTTDSEGRLVINTSGYNMSGWASSAIEGFIAAKNNTGQKLVVESITSKYPKMKAYVDGGGGYEIGVFILDKDGKELADTGGVYLSTDSSKPLEIEINASNSSYKYPAKVSVADGTDVQIAIQFFKMTDTSHSGSIEITDPEEMRELESIFSLK